MVSAKFFWETVATIKELWPMDTPMVKEGTSSAEVATTKDKLEITQLKEEEDSFIKIKITNTTVNG